MDIKQPSNYPIFLNFNDKKILLIGGGRVAYVKLLSLLEYSFNVEIVSLDFSQDLKDAIVKYNLKYLQKSYTKDILQGYDIIIAAIDDIDLQSQIYKDSRVYRCLCSCADLSTLSDFTFGSIIKDGDLSIAISTSGVSPAFSKYLKEHINKLLPDGISSFLGDMKKLRLALPKGRQRMELFSKMAKEFFEK